MKINPADVSYASEPQPDFTLLLVCIEGVFFGGVVGQLVKGHQEAM